VKTIKQNVWGDPKVWISFGLLGLAVVSLILVSDWCWFGIGGVVSVSLVDFYMVCVFFIAAIQSDVKNGNLDFTLYQNFGRRWRWLPIRTAGLIMVGTFFLTDVLGFAAVFRAMPDGYFNHPLAHWWEAVYFSIVTIATVGYGDFLPVKVWSEAIIIGQIASGLLLLAGIVSFVIARISGFDSSAINEDERQEMVDGVWPAEVKENSIDPDFKIGRAAKEQIIEAMKRLIV
jgi:Ion channel